MSRALENWIASLPPKPAKLLEHRQLRLTIPGPPRTKKNSPVLIGNIGVQFLVQLLSNCRPWFSTGITDGQIYQKLKVMQDAKQIKFPPPRMLPSKAYREWEEEAIEQTLPIVATMRDYLPIDYPVHVYAEIYREANVGDVNGFTDGLADFLQKIGVLSNDVLIRSWDGTRLLKDGGDPRIELAINPYSVESETGLFAKNPKGYAGKYELPQRESVNDMVEAAPRPLVSAYKARKEALKQLPKAKLNDKEHFEWPAPNEDGLYECDPEESLWLRRGHGYIEVQVLQIADEKWITAVNVEAGAGVGLGGFSSRLDAREAYPTYGVAIGVTLYRVKERIVGLPKHGAAQQAWALLVDAATEEMVRRNVPGQQLIADYRNPDYKRGPHSGSSGK